MWEKTRALSEAGSKTFAGASFTVFRIDKNTKYVFRMDKNTKYVFRIDKTRIQNVSSASHQTDSFDMD